MSIAPVAMWYHDQPFKDTKGKDIRQPHAVRLDNQKQLCAGQVQKHRVHPKLLKLHVHNILHNNKKFTFSVSTVFQFFYIGLQINIT